MGQNQSLSVGDDIGITIAAIVVLGFFLYCFRPLLDRCPRPAGPGAPEPDNPSSDIESRGPASGDVQLPTPPSSRPSSGSLESWVTATEGDRVDPQTRYSNRPTRPISHQEIQRATTSRHGESRAAWKAPKRTSHRHNQQKGKHLEGAKGQSPTAQGGKRVKWDRQQKGSSKEVASDQRRQQIKQESEPDMKGVISSTQTITEETPSRRCGTSFTAEGSRPGDKRQAKERRDRAVSSQSLDLQATPTAATSNRPASQA